MENNVCKILGHNIKKIRSSRGLTQNKLAELLNIEVKSLSLIETGKGFASAKTIEKLSSVLDIQVAELFEVNDLSDNELLYSKILNRIQLIKNNTQKLEALDFILKRIF